MNKIDKVIEQKAHDYFDKLGFTDSWVEFKTKELLICIERGYNSRAEIWNLLKEAERSA